MPFTFSHPAIVLPLAAKRLRLSATGLVIGSMIPDFEYFIRMKTTSKFSHTISGLFWFDLPLALLVCFIYHILVRNSLVDNLPMFFKQRLSAFKSFSWTDYFSRNWIAVCVSIIIGAASHIVWDAFTHDTMFFVQKDPDLSTVMRLGTINLAGYRFLQLASSFIGLFVVFLAIVSLKKRPVKDPSIDYRYWLVMTLIVLLVMFLRFVIGLDITFLRRVLVSLISSIFIGLILTPTILIQMDEVKKIAETNRAEGKIK